MEKTVEQLQEEVHLLQVILANCKQILQLTREKNVPHNVLQAHVESSIHEALDTLERTGWFDQEPAETHGNPAWSQQETTDNPYFRVSHMPNGSNYHDHLCRCPSCEPF